MNEEPKIINCVITGETTPEEAKAMIDAAFETISQCGGYMSYSSSPFDRMEGEEVPHEVKLKRVQEAIDAFSQHPEIFEF